MHLLFTFFQVVEVGSYSDLMQQPDSLFSSLIDEFGNDQVKSSFLPASLVATPALRSAAVPDFESSEGKIIQKEVSQVGGVKSGVFVSYLSYIGIAASVVAIVFLIVEALGSFGSSYWLGIWSSRDPASMLHSPFFWIGFYCMFGGLAAVGSLAVGLLLAFAAVSASRHLHNNLLANLVRAPSYFFDTTPTGDRNVKKRKRCFCFFKT
jgi:hypothetical protein